MLPSIPELPMTDFRLRTAQRSRAEHPTVSARFSKLASCNASSVTSPMKEFYGSHLIYKCLHQSDHPCVNFPNNIMAVGLLRCGFQLFNFQRYWLLHRLFPRVLRFDDQFCVFTLENFLFDSAPFGSLGPVSMFS